MWDIAWMFWLIPFFFFLMMTRRWRRAHWAYAAGSGSVRLERELAEHRDYVDSLERRIAELEDRLDFTERLLAQRNQGAVGAV
jgi:hypothetical protein